MGPKELEKYKNKMQLWLTLHGLTVEEYFERPAWANSTCVACVHRVGGHGDDAGDCDISSHPRLWLCKENKVTVVFQLWDRNSRNFRCIEWIKA